MKLIITTCLLLFGLQGFGQEISLNDLQGVWNSKSKKYTHSIKISEDKYFCDFQNDKKYYCTLEKINEKFRSTCCQDWDYIEFFKINKGMLYVQVVKLSKAKERKVIGTIKYIKGHVEK